MTCTSTVRPSKTKAISKKFESRVSTTTMFLLTRIASPHPRAYPTTTRATNDGKTPNTNTSTYLCRLDSRSPLCDGCLSDRILSKTRAAKVQHENICSNAATNGNAKCSLCLEIKKPVNTDIMTALATPSRSAARPMRAEINARSIASSLPPVLVLLAAII